MLSPDDDACYLALGKKKVVRLLVAESDWRRQLELIAAKQAGEE